ncbi:MAG: hypothetical protein ABSB41_10130 [Anaerolineales bacterium]
MLFLDEPTRGLDPISARDIRGIIDQLRQEGTTILLTTHLLEEADQLCQQLAFIVGGHLVAGGAPRDLKLSHGKRTMVLTLADSKNTSRLPETTLRMDDPADQVRLAELMAQGKVRSIHSQEATLEEVFIQVAGIRPA